MNAKFIKYKNLNGNSPILEYRLNNDIYNSIDIVFKNKINFYYRYSVMKLIKSEIEEMKRLAEKGSGLCTYIKKYIRKRHDLINPI